MEHVGFGCSSIIPEPANKHFENLMTIHRFLNLWGGLGWVLGHLEGGFGRFGAILKASWLHLGGAWRLFEGLLGPLQGVLASSWGHVWASWGSWEDCGAASEAFLATFQVCCSRCPFFGIFLICCCICSYSFEMDDPWKTMKNHGLS